MKDMMAVTLGSISQPEGLTSWHTQDHPKHFLKTLHREESHHRCVPFLGHLVRGSDRAAICRKVQPSVQQQRESPAGSNFPPDPTAQAVPNNSSGQLVVRWDSIEATSRKLNRAGQHRSRRAVLMIP
ncbi:hypothetical protein FIBSPDRAFT_349798 [Athelia psychrophila]|uniref:Uncharacterized protein n=1 Tax=Athelia psychrophila TaxID=1759441 RepID=A0A167VYV9_9AGAM|nr:hypothetical protein FIBSPDRAFT_349798 [Fibularhizoctonia sp. CBS 109695]